MSKRIVLAICGASGSVYGIRLLKALVESRADILLVVSDAGRQVLKHETGYTGDNLRRFLIDNGTIQSQSDQVRIYEPHNLFAPMASGSFKHDGMVIAPCSMKTLGSVANGFADTLIARSADVCIKEKRRLIMVPRESPLSAIHLENMLKLVNAGAVIMPPMPAFYLNPESIEKLVDVTVARILDHLDIDHQISKSWGDEENVAR